MRILLLCSLISAIIVLTTADCHADGEPGCKTPGEVYNTFANFFDPTLYWRCVALNAKAVSERCFNGMAYQASKGFCVKWTDWKWEEPTPPRSCPDYLEDLPVEEAA